MESLHATRALYGLLHHLQSTGRSSEDLQQALWSAIYKAINDGLESCYRSD